MEKGTTVLCSFGPSHCLHPKRELGTFNCACTAKPRDKQTTGLTDAHATGTSVAIVPILCIWCGLTIRIELQEETAVTLLLLMLHCTLRLIAVTLTLTHWPWPTDLDIRTDVHEGKGVLRRSALDKSSSQAGSDSRTRNKRIRAGLDLMLTRYLPVLYVCWCRPWWCQSPVVRWVNNR